MFSQQAARYGHEAVARLLLENRADVNAIDNANKVNLNLSKKEIKSLNILLKKWGLSLKYLFFLFMRLRELLFISESTRN